MTIVTTRYIRKPLYVDAVKVTPFNFAAIASWCQGKICNLESDREIEDYSQIEGDKVNQHYIRVRVHNPKNHRQTQLRVGDWLLYTERGYKVYTEKAFFNSFEEVQEKSESVLTAPENATP